MPDRADVPRLERRARGFVLVMTALIIACIVAWIWSSRASPAATLWGALAAAPLFVLLPLLARGHRRAYAAGTLCLVPYLVIALTELIANPAARAWAGAVLLTSFTTFIGLIAYLRVTRPS